MNASLLPLVLVAQITTVGDYFDPPAPNPPQVLTTVRPGTTGPTQYVAPAHATLLPDGRVLMIGFAHDAVGGTDGDLSFVGVMTPPPAYVTLAPEHPVEWEPAPVEDTGTWHPDPEDPPGAPPRWFRADFTFCAGQTLLSDGSVFTAGGTRLLIDMKEPVLRHWLTGMDYAMIRRFGASPAWNRVVAKMIGTGEVLGPGTRWYPTATRLHDGKILVTSGVDLIQITDPNGNIPRAWEPDGPYLYLFPNRSVELFDPGTESWSLVSSHADAPADIFNPDYTHVFPLPADAAPGGFDTLLFGASGVPVLLSRTAPEPGRWIVRNESPRPQTVPGESPNYSATSCPLPFRLQDGEWGYANGAALVTGGDHGSSHVHSIDVYDPAANAWLPRRDMGVHRHLPMTTLLPDGRVLIAAGVGMPQAQTVNYLDPKAGMQVQVGTATMPEPRGYHSVSLLLPDGRVMIAGGRTHGHEAPSDEQPTLRYLYPSYMFDPMRSVIWQAPDVVHYGETFGVIWAGREVDDVVLIGLGAMTHAFDANQRYVELGVAWQVEPDPVAKPNERVGGFVAPADARTAPPGYYMLFLVDGNRTAGYAKIVKLE